MEKTNTNVEISRLLEYGLQRGLIAPEDKAYAANRMLALLGLREFEPQPVEEELHTPVEPLERLCQFAAEAGLIDPDTRDGRDQFDTELMNCLMPRPSQVVGEFYSLYEKDKQAATDYYYQLARSSNYIRVDRIEKDRMWTAPTPYGDLVITINLSKPEKDPKAIAAAKNAPQSGYPKCALCRENEGYLGSANQAARGNHRLIPLELGGEPWFLQYSPYVYYNEHCIVLSHEHRPMKVSRQSISRLLEFVTFLPHYFVGSNADLPIVGGSILSHMHFQGGSYAFPMQSAETLCRYRVPEYPDISVETIRWPVSTVRACGRDAAQLIGFAGRLLETWRGYSDAEADILAETMENGSPTPHNTVTPILHYDEKKGYVLDLVPRNNRTTEQYPEGIFHPHREIHHIKKENIGLIEVMGLAILPSRLAQQSEAIAAVLCGQTDAKACRAAAPEHADWLDLLVKKYGTALSPEQAQDAVKREIGAKFETCLEHAGVFKLTPDGLAAFDRFLTALGCEKL